MDEKRGWPLLFTYSTSFIKKTGRSKCWQGGEDAEAGRNVQSTPLWKSVRFFELSVNSRYDSAVPILMFTQETPKHPWKSQRQCSRQPYL